MTETSDLRERAKAAVAEHDCAPDGSLMDGDSVVSCRCGETFVGWDEADQHVADAVLATLTPAARSSSEDPCAACGKPRREHRPGYSAYRCTFRDAAAPDGDLRERAASMAQRLDVLSYDLMVGGQDNAYRSTMAISGVPDLRTAANLLRVLAALPAPVVSVSARYVPDAVDAIHDAYDGDPDSDQGFARAVLADVIVALGLTVADAPEAGERRG